MRSGQVNTFGVNSTGVIPATLVDVQALSVGRARIGISRRTVAVEAASSVNTFSALCAGIVRAFVDVWDMGGVNSHRWAAKGLICWVVCWWFNDD